MIVTLSNVSKSYKVGDLMTPALQDVSMQVKKGSFLAMCGPSGSGKTTLLSLIGALDHPTSGSVTVDGVNLTELKSRDLALLRRDKIGFVFQAYNLIPVYTALENTSFTLGLQGIGKKERTERARAALSEVGLSGFENRLPRQLSGGQQQRVAVARALAVRPAVILADEPTANLDSKTADNLLDLMQTLNAEQKMTFIFSTHDQRIVQRASQTVFMRDGKIVDQSGDQS